MQADVKEKIIADCKAGAGLANRIKCILSCLRIDAGARILWSADAHRRVEFSELFETPLPVEQLGAGGQVIDTWQFMVLERDRLPPFTGCNAVSWEKSPCPKIDHLYNDMPKHVERELRELTTALRPHRLITEAVDKIAVGLKHDAVGVHIRSWYDHAARHLFHKEKYFRQAMASLRGAHFYLCSDDVRVLRPLMKAFPGQCTLIESLLSEFKLTPGQTDFAEMLLLSKMQKLIVTEGSTFTEISWLYANGKQEIFIVKPSKARVWVYLHFLYPYSRYAIPLQGWKLAALVSPLRWLLP